MANLKRHEDEIVHIACFEHKYEDGTEVRLCSSSLCVKEGEFVVITGPNGSGKSTLINHVAGLFESVKGEIRIMGVDAASKSFEKVRRYIGVVFQDADEQLVAPTVLDDVAFSPLNYGFSKGEAKRMALDVLEKLGISSLAPKVPHYLSGGEKKKVALAGAIVMNPKILVIDEIFANMDEESKRKTVKLFSKLNRENKTTILLVTHELELLSGQKYRLVRLGEKEKRKSDEMRA